MANSGKLQSISVDEIELDTSNPRIAPFLEHLEKPLTAEAVFMALGAGSEDEGAGGSTFNRLKQSILTNGGIIQPVMLRRLSSNKYLCIEGNTRVQLYREFLQRGTSGEWREIMALVHDELDDEDVHAIRLQAHLVGPRAWTPYAKAKYLDFLRNHEHFPFSRLVDFCGGSEKAVVESLNAYSDMERHYRTQLESDEDFDVNRFSGFVELQKPGIKEAIRRAGYDLDDFARWIRDRKIDKLAHVRWLPKVLKDKKATEMFLTSGIEDAIRHSDVPDLSRALQDATIVSLARALTEGLRRIEFREVKSLKDDPSSQTAQYLIEAHEELKAIMAEIGVE